MSEGIDYSYGSGLGAAAIKAAGKAFVCRYLAPLPNSKCINKAEFDNLVGAGLHVVLVWEGTGHESGAPAGTNAAREADRQATALGAHGVPLYFAPADYDVPPGDQAGINAYLDGAATVIGRGRVGLYGGYYPVKRAFDAGKCHYGWQTYAWSGGQWDHRAQLQQYKNAAKLGPADVDLDRSTAGDYGQWPRPPATHPPAAPAGPHKHVTKAGDTIHDIAVTRNMKVEDWLAYQRKTGANVAALTDGPLPAGLTWYSLNP